MVAELHRPNLLRLLKEEEQESEASDELWKQLESDKKVAKNRNVDCDKSRSTLARVAGHTANAKKMLPTVPAGSERSARAEREFRVVGKENERLQVALALGGEAKGGRRLEWKSENCSMVTAGWELTG